jgi:hypothetical protein
MDSQITTSINQNSGKTKRLGRGRAQIPDSMTFKELRNKLKSENPDIKEIQQNK